MAFKLSIVRAPEGSYWWKAVYNDRTIQADWLRIGVPWYCPYDANGATDLQVLVYSQDFWDQLHRKDDLGPIYDGKEYTYDCATGELTEGPYVPPIAILYLREHPYWNGSEWVDDPPDVEPGGELGVRTIAENVSAETHYVGIRTTINDPLGGGVAHVINSILAPGATLGSYIKHPVTIPGIWTAIIRLCLSPTYPYDVIQTIGPIPVGNVIGVIPPVTGHLYDPLVYDATTREVFHEGDFPAGIVLGHEVNVVIYRVNDGSEPAIFETTIELIDPDGIVREVTMRRGELGAGESFGLTTDHRVELDKEGVWKIHATLKDGRGNLLDEGTWDAIDAGAPPVEFQGTITRIELDYDAVRLPVPVSDVPIGVSGSVLIGGTNNTAAVQQMGARWKVIDPDGVEVDSYEDWEMWPYTSPGAEHRFVGNRFNLDKVGTYTLEVDLLMNYASPVVVDSYSGDLCTTTTEVPPTYELIQHTVYHFAYIYDGDVEVSTATFKTDPFTPSAWMADRFASKIEEEYRARGGNVLEVKVYVDVTPLLWTDYRIELIGTPLGEEVAAAPGIGVAGIPIAIAVLIIALAIIAVIVVVTLMWERFMATFEHKPGLEDVKPAWGKEALILDIQDAEEHWERTPTPIATLEAMSEQELRDQLDQIAEEEVPPTPPAAELWPLVLIGGVAVVGVGAAVALAARPKKKEKA